PAPVVAWAEVIAADSMSTTGAGTTRMGEASAAPLTSAAALVVASSDTGPGRGSAPPPLARAAPTVPATTSVPTATNAGHDVRMFGHERFSIGSCPPRLFLIGGPRGDHGRLDA